MTIGGKIRRYRKLAGLTTEELAKRVNVSRPTISRYESDEINISVDMIGKIAKALNISPVELLDLSYLDSEVEAVPVPTLGAVACCCAIVRTTKKCTKKRPSQERSERRKGQVMMSFFEI